MKNSRPYTHVLPIVSVIAGLVCSVVMARQAAAANVKLGVYQGVLDFVWNASPNILEFGYLGRDIAGSSNITFRPGSVSAANAAAFVRSGSVVNLDVSGKVCLYNHASGLAVDCRDVWPAGGSGGSYWQVVTQNVSGIGNRNFLQTKDGSNQPTYSVHIGSSSQRITGGTAVTVNGAGSVGLQAVNLNTSGSAAQFSGNVTVGLYGTSIDGTVRIAGQEVWSSGFSWYNHGHQGADTGLDADTLDGQNVTLEGPASCSDDTNPPYNAPRILCLCFTIRNGASSTKHCTPMSNYGPIP